MFNKYRGGKITTVRPVNAYGPGQSIAAPFGPSKVRKIMPAFICRALTGSPIEVYGDGTQISDCVYVGDVARVFVAALEYTAEHGAIENPLGVGPKTSVAVNQVARQVARAAHYQTGQPEVALVHLPMRPGEVPNAVVNADTSSLEVLPEEYWADNFVPLEIGIQETVDHYHTNWLPRWKESE
jgi:UDP-glucose 4-epimerase